MQVFMNGLRVLFARYTGGGGGGGAIKREIHGSMKTNSKRFFPLSFNLSIFAHQFTTLANNSRYTWSLMGANFS